MLVLNNPHGVGLARARGHLHQGPVEVLISQGLSISLMAVICAGRSDSISSSGRSRTLARQVGRSGSSTASRAIRDKGRRLGEVEDATDPGLWIIPVSEVCLRPAGFEDEGQPVAHSDRPELPQ